MDISKLKSEYEIEGCIESRLESVYPTKVTVDVPIEHIDYDCGINYTSDRAVRLIVEVLYPNYPKEEVKNAMKIACLKFLEELC